MATQVPANTFNSAIQTWIQETGQPWSRLKYELARANLTRHLPMGSLHILDAGGGTGSESIPLAAGGHRVELVDYSEAMLQVARQGAADAQVDDRFLVHKADVQSIAEMFEPDTFDVVICHNVVQYVGDVPSLLRALAAPLKPGGILSLISMNRYASPWRAAFLWNNLEQAYDLIDQHTDRVPLFDQVVTLYSGEEVSSMLPDAGLALERYYGIRCLWDYGGDNQKRAEVVDQLRRIEFALTDRYPYNLLARFWQIITVKI